MEFLTSCIVSGFKILLIKMVPAIIAKFIKKSTLHFKISRFRKISVLARKQLVAYLIFVYH